MRQIKFRAWDGENMVTEPAYIQILGANDFHVFSDETGDWINEGIHLMQFTGLTDKNGKEIYEGDIMKGRFADGAGGVSTRYKSFNFDVCYFDDLARFYFHMPKNYGRYRFHPSLTDSEVIGNIYEHPHLLNQGETPETCDATGDTSRGEPL